MLCELLFMPGLPGGVFVDNFAVNFLNPIEVPHTIWIVHAYVKQYSDLVFCITGVDIL
jgi:hypothetical protein